MISGVDSSVILDVLTGDATFADASESVLRQGAEEGQLVLCECVLAEICPAFTERERLEEFLNDWQLEFVPSSHKSALLAGALFTQYLRRGGKPGRLVPDFLIAAHAQQHCDRLIARDRGFLRDYFADLVVLNPTT